MEEIILRSSIGKSLVIQTNTTRPLHNVEEVLKVRKNVYEDVEYTIQIPDLTNVDKINVYVNGEPRLGYTNGSEFVFFDNKIFDNILGFAQISLLVIRGEQNDWFYSEYLSVLIRPSRNNRSVSAMIKFIYENQGDFLFHESLRPELGGNKAKDDFWAQVLLIEEIANVYEDCYGYFMANSRYTLKRIDVLDSIEKLQFVDSKTIQYMVQHPEYMERSAVGIGYGTKRYLPRKTMMSQNSKTYDIYENQIVLGFLEYMLNSISGFKKELEEYLKYFQIEESVENGYLISSFIIYENAKKQIKEFSDRMELLYIRFGQLLRSYKGVMRVSENKECLNPRLTAVFANVPQYNRIYNCISNWNNRGIYSLEKERMMMSFFNAPEIFEIYMLTKLILQLQDMGFNLSEVKHVKYPGHKEWRDNSKKINNTFSFEQGNQKVTVYYEPVIYKDDLSDINGIFLYRNNTVSLNKDSEDELRGDYYIPDYVIKYEDSDKENYIICDAKYTYQSRLKFKHIPDLAFKYLTSISAIRHDAVIKGMYLFYGITDTFIDGESFFDVKIDGVSDKGQEIMMIPFSEEVPYAYQDNNTYELIQRLMK
ncbi:DUF2357 domain-containing protein [Butyrivibrio sp. XBB1001]|uniref:DUF2357 domain-containing protein n=1 Tax=Butyrivibrio sp. XBB1001 TaxID=1280682 RepID=UPI00040532B3|nr:DUF2357 domain-containing protein [Butyrivibrio sp. XBB1001]